MAQIEAFGQTPGGPVPPTSTRFVNRVGLRAELPDVSRMETIGRKIG